MAITDLAWYVYILGFSIRFKAFSKTPSLYDASCGTCYISPPSPDAQRRHESLQKIRGVERAIGGFGSFQSSCINIQTTERERGGRRITSHLSIPCIPRVHRIRLRNSLDVDTRKRSDNFLLGIVALEKG
jgi:hypothetical protein